MCRIFLVKKWSDTTNPKLNSSEPSFVMLFDSPLLRFYLIALVWSNRLKDVRDKN